MNRNARVVKLPQWCANGRFAVIQAFKNRKTRPIHVHLNQACGLFVKPLVFWGTLAVLTVLYCLPGHPSAGQLVPWDIALHVGLFAGLGLVLAHARETRARRLIILTILAIALEIGQWLAGQFRQIEIVDILSNEAGVALAAFFYWGVQRSNR